MEYLGRRQTQGAVDRHIRSVETRRRRSFPCFGASRACSAWPVGSTELFPVGWGCSKERRDEHSAVLIGCLGLVLPSFLEPGQQ